MANDPGSDAGYDNMLPAQQSWLDSLMSTPTATWPESLMEFIRSHAPTSWDELTHWAGVWIKEQHDLWKAICAAAPGGSLRAT